MARCTTKTRAAPTRRPLRHPSGGPIEFSVEYPSAGRYRLFLQFKHDGEVRTAAFTREVDDERH